MTEISAAGDSHVGQVRRGNEDALLVGTSVFAVADGMGGHVAGEVASETALNPIARLDGRVFADADVAQQALRDAVREANRLVLERADDTPDLRGMGTTLTVAMIEHRRLHVAHVGDSRAYLLRDGELVQLTRDHTLVRDLVDEGQITEQQAADHPQRSIITRAIGVAEDIDVDAVTMSLRRGDRVLLCSDGLTNVVDDDEIAHRLLGADGLEAAIDTLIEQANERGGPDNITAVGLAFDDDRIGDSAARTTGELTPVAGRDAVVVDTSEDVDAEDWAGGLGRLAPADSDRPERSPLRRAGALLLGVLVLVALAVGIGWWQLSRSYYVGLDDDRVAIYRGVPTRVGPLALSWVDERTGLTVSEVPTHLVDDLGDGLLAADAADARRIVDNARVKGAEEAAEEAADEAATGGPTAPATTPGSQPSASPRGTGADGTR